MLPCWSTIPLGSLIRAFTLATWYCCSPIG
jgi:hypothetical protein